MGEGSEIMLQHFGIDTGTHMYFDTFPNKENTKEVIIDFILIENLTMHQ